SQLAMNLGADDGQDSCKVDQPVEFCGCAVGLPLVMVTVLLATAVILAGGLDMPGGERAYPDIVPGGGNDECPDAGKILLAGEFGSVRIAVEKAGSGAVTGETGLRRIDKSQTRFLRRKCGIG